MSPGRLFAAHSILVWGCSYCDFLLLATALRQRKELIDLHLVKMQAYMGVQLRCLAGITAVFIACNRYVSESVVVFSLGVDTAWHRIYRCL